MEVKQEEAVIKTEPEFVCVQSERCSTKQQTFNNDPDNVLGNMVSICEYQTSGQFVNVDKIKQEIIECEVPKIEKFSNVQTKVDRDSVLENLQISSKTIKRELENASEVKAADIKVINQEVSQYVQFKDENEFLTSYCDLPTLKNEDIDYPDYFTQPCSSKQLERTLKPPRHVNKLVSKQKRRYRSPICRKKSKLEQDLEDIIIAGGDDDDIEAVILWSILGDDETEESDECDEDDLSGSD